MSRKYDETNYFKIGTFILLGIGLIIGMLLLFGVNKILQPVVYVETYFEESIHGIDMGTAVKYRGLQIGYVKDVAFTQEIYNDARSLKSPSGGSLIYVKIAITSKLFTMLQYNELRRFFKEEVKHGLRVRLVAQGLTGMHHLEFDYVDPQENNVPVLSWGPKFFYVPAVTSTLTELREDIQHILEEFKSVDFNKLFKDFNALINNLDRVTQKTENLFDKVEEPLTKSIVDWQATVRNLRVLSQRLKLKPSDIVFSSYPPPLDPKKL